MFKRFILVLSLGMFWVNPLYAADRILAVVNKDTITQSEADIYLNMVILQLSQQYTGKALEEKVEDEKKQLLERMIEDKVILQEAKRKNLMARPDKVKQRIEQMKTAYDSDIDFENSLKPRGLTIHDIENKISDQMIMHEIVEQGVRDKILVNPDEVTQYYAKHKQDFQQSETRTIESLYLEDEAMIEKLKEDLKNNPDFQALADQYKAAYVKDTVEKVQLRAEMQERIFSLKIGEASEPIHAEKGSYAFKLLEIHNPRLLSLDDAHEKIYNYLFEQKFTVKMLEWLSELKAKAYIEVKK